MVGMASQDTRVLSYGAMKASTDRILTTHTGSLPRPDDLTALLEALDAGSVPDLAAFEARVRQRGGRHRPAAARRPASTSSTTASRARCGYSTYVRHRLTGFGGQQRAPRRGPTGPTFPRPPRARAALDRRAPGVRRPHRLEGPRRPCGKDTANLARRSLRRQPTEAFMTAASPGVIAHFLQQRALSDAARPIWRGWSTS